MTSTSAPNQVAFTPLKKHPYNPASYCTVTLKQFTDNDSRPGTLVRTLVTDSWWSASFYEWTDMRGDGLIVEGPNYLCVILHDGSGFNSKSISCIWEEM